MKKITKYEYYEKEINYNSTLGPWCKLPGPTGRVLFLIFYYLIEILTLLLIIYKIYNPIKVLLLSITCLLSMIFIFHHNPLWFIRYFQILYLKKKKVKNEFDLLVINIDYFINAMKISEKISVQKIILSLFNIKKIFFYDKRKEKVKIYGIITRNSLSIKARIKRKYLHLVNKIDKNVLSSEIKYAIDDFKRKDEYLDFLRREIKSYKNKVNEIIKELLINLDK